MISTRVSEMRSAIMELKIASPAIRKNSMDDAEAAVPGDDTINKDIDFDEDSGFYNDSYDDEIDSMRKRTDSRSTRRSSAGIDDLDLDSEDDNELDEPLDDSDASPGSTKIAPNHSIRSLLEQTLQIDISDRSSQNFNHTSYVRSLARVTEVLGDTLPESLLRLLAGYLYEGDSGSGLNEVPDWLDRAKFHRGQIVAQENRFGLAYAQMLSLFTVFSFHEALKPLIMTGASSTPYTAFRRYLSTGCRVQNWRNYDPWTPGTPSYNDINCVRKLHQQVRKQIREMSPEQFVERTTVQKPCCPLLETTRQDFVAACPAPRDGQCPFEILRTKAPSLSQGEMSTTQFAFCGLFLLYPKHFGAHDVTEEDLEAYCHYWRGLGYLLGIEDEINFCRGSLEDVRARSRDFIEYWVKPNFRIIKPECEHMMRCMVEGLQYYFPGVTYETSILDLSKLFNLNTPRLYSSLSYFAWIKYCGLRFYFDYLAKASAIRWMANNLLVQAMEMAKNFGEKRHKNLQLRSARTLERYVTDLPK